MAGKRSNLPMPGSGPAVRLGRKPLAKGHLSPLTTPSDRPFPCLRDSPLQHPDYPSLSGGASRRAKVAAHWDESRAAPQRIPARFLTPGSRLAPPPTNEGPASAPSSPGEVAPAPRTPPRRQRATSFSTAVRTAPGPASEGEGAAGGRQGRAGEGSGPYTQAGGRGTEPLGPPRGRRPPRSRTLLRPRRAETPGAGARVAPGRGRGRKMPVRRGHVAPQNTYLDTIIRKFEGQSECVRWGGGTIWSPGSVAEIVRPLC